MITGLCGWTDLFRTMQKKIKSLKWFLNRFTKIKKIFHAPSEKRQQKPCVDAAEEAAAAAAAIVLPPRQPLPLFGV